MASAVHQNCHRLLTLLLRPLPAPAPHPRVSFSPRPAGVRSFFPAPGCRLGTDAVALAEPELVPPEEEDDGTRFVVVTFYKFLPLEDPRAEVASHLHFLQLEGGSLHLPLLDPSMRAMPLTPSKWKERLEARACLDVSSSEMSGRKLLLLDVRNDYEWDVGHFEGVQRPNVDCFRSTSFGLSGEVSDPLNGVDKEKTDILMYCTGGIRCDVYSTILRCWWWLCRKKGFQNLYTLEGGVSNYLKAEGPAGWVGNLFVFDGRLSLPPATFRRPAACWPSSPSEEEKERRWVGRCYACGSEVVELRHRNCANIDCNRLYMSCGWCAEELAGCCCSDCKAAPRLRPLLPGHQRYLKWHVYRDGLLTPAATDADC
ncbi:rhodanese-like domain-containing protein 8, chloroplastic isoform X8 [Panicum virgatum]|uniref:rhodanese-like domain-containing protein 8, chloroplastic isoform X8 n=1 Tax=Panicum virgatum TaxID=38727 RepID=UPI0019D61D06|nr:rhodanese-like domain-containing protein 8, chloroplastic isoform X8 [Panicum virgatum]